LKDFLQYQIEIHTDYLIMYFTHIPDQPEIRKIPTLQSYLFFGHDEKMCLWP